MALRELAARRHPKAGEGGLWPDSGASTTTIAPHSSEAGSAGAAGFGGSPVMVEAGRRAAGIRGDVDRVRLLVPESQLATWRDAAKWYSDRAAPAPGRETPTDWSASEEVGSNPRLATFDRRGARVVGFESASDVPQRPAVRSRDAVGARIPIDSPTAVAARDRLDGEHPQPSAPRRDSSPLCHGGAMPVDIGSILTAGRDGGEAQW